MWSRGPYHILDGRSKLELFAYQCPKCAQLVVDVAEYSYQTARVKMVPALEGISPEKMDQRYGFVRSIQVIPAHSERSCPSQVPVSIASDYREATRIAHLSQKGAATLARRCMQSLLRDKYPAMPMSVRKQSLNAELEWVLGNGGLDSELSKPLKGLKDIGNFGAHPSREDSLTELYELSAKDLEACFALLELLFDELYVKPAGRKEKLRHLAEWGKKQQESPRSDS